MVAILAATSVFAQKKPMNEFIDELISKMTLEEKIGQLNLLPGNDITTGAVMNSPLAQLTAEGKLGAVLNVKGQDKIKELQRIAVKKSRLGIPLLIGQDVIHGNQTVFPIPLAQACSWDIKAIENGARIAAKEATAQGINWVYSPMVDIAIDPRWGRVAEGAGEDPFLGCRIGEALVATGKPVVLLNFSGRPTVMSWEAENVPAILNVWFGGSETGDAICDVLFGEKSPSGHLTMTMPKALGQIPIYYNHLNTGRPVPEGAKEYRKYQSNYIDVRNDPLYPFGYGLSYTTFEYGKPRLSSTTMNADGTLTLTINVNNTGKYDADEVVQLYIRDLAASISRPVKELKGFERISLKAGESRDVNFTIDVDMLKFYNSDLQFVAEPGDFEVMVGGNSRDVQKLKFTLQ